MSDQINYRNRQAQLVSRASSELFILFYFDQRIEIEQGVICGVKQDGIRVMVQKYGVESLITLVEPENQSQWKYNDEKLTLSGPNNRKYKVFDQIEVVVSVKHGKNRRKWMQIELANSKNNNFTDIEMNAETKKQRTT